MQATFTNSSYIFATLRLDENQVNGYGAAVAPRLMLPFKLDFAFSKIGVQRRLDMRRLSARLQFGNIYLDSVQGAFSLTISHAYSTYNDYQVVLEFPTAPAVIAALEVQRAGGNLKATVWADLEFEDVHLVAKAGETDIWTIAKHERAQVSQQIEIPASSWISRVLPQIGYGIVHVLELPAVPLEEHQNFKDAFTALKQASDFHRTGHYNDVAARCRIALEKFMEYIEVPDGPTKTKKIPRLKASWETRVGKATYDWLNTCLTSVKIAANPTAHSPNQHFDQLESQMLLAITTGLVAYAARSAPSEKKE